MTAINKILVPTDFSEASKEAFKFAFDLAKKNKASLKVLHVYRADFGVPVPDMMAYQLIDLRREEAEKKMADFVQSEPSAANNGVEMETVTEVGFPTDVAIEYSKNSKEAIDFIVMGSKGEHPLTDRLFGSVSTNVLMNADCPVIAIPEKCSFSAIKNIAYATDFKDENLEILRRISELAKLFDAKLHCVSVDTNSSDLRDEVQKFKAMLEQLNLDAEIFKISSDSIAEGLDGFVHENGIDMVIMHRPKRKFLERLFHNSVTKQVAMNRTVPLLVFKK
jgi:nucleotide-binding universal stress UspA family protein